MTSGWWRLGLVAAAIGAGIAASVAHGAPVQMPGASLDWPLLLHLERAVALIALTSAALLVGVRATRGRFPVKFGQIEYPAGEIERRDETVVDAHEQRLLVIEEMLQIALPSGGDDRR